MRQFSISLAQDSIRSRKINTYRSKNQAPAWVSGPYRNRRVNPPSDPSFACSSRHIFPFILNPWPESLNLPSHQRFSRPTINSLLELMAHSTMPYVFSLYSYCLPFLLDSILCPRRVVNVIFLRTKIVVFYEFRLLDLWWIEQQQRKNESLSFEFILSPSWRGMEQIPWWRRYC